MAATKTTRTRKTAAATMERKPATRRKAKGRAWHVALGVSALGVMVLLMYVSMGHLAESVIMLTASTSLIAYLCAVGIDVGMVISEVTQIVGKKEAQAHATQYLWSATALSMMLNVLSFCSHAESMWLWVPCTVLGVAVPAAILWLGKISTKLLLNK